MRFPVSEAETAALIQEMIDGLANNVTLYPSPPLVPIALSTSLATYMARKKDAVAAEALSQQAFTDKNEALQIMIDDMKQDLRYAENTVNYDDDKLKLIGNSPRLRLIPCWRWISKRRIQRSMNIHSWVDI